MERLLVFRSEGRGPGGSHECREGVCCRTYLACASTALALSLSLAIAAPAAHAADLVVSTLADSGAGSLREAITTANGNGTDDVITFSVSGQTTLTSPLPDIAAAGALTIQGGDNITISGNGAARVFTVVALADLTLENLTVSGGRVSGDADGAGINNSGTLTLTGCTLSGNSAGDDGGALYNGAGASATITGCTFTGNDAGWGGAIDSDGTLTIVDSTFESNQALYGGAIDTWFTAGVTGSTFSLNHALDDGGAISNYGGATLTVAASLFADNTADDDGGGIYNDAGCTTTVTGSTFGANIAGWGGGIDNDGMLTVANSLFADNEAEYGGGIDTWNVASIVNSTFFENTGTTAGGGIFNNAGDSAALTNTIVANSTAGGNCSGTITDGGNNLDSANTCGFLLNALINTDPLLGPSTGDLYYQVPGPGSPAIDAANNSACAAWPVNNTSQNGVTRPQDGDGDGSAVCDIGACESSLIFADGFESGDTGAWM